MKSNHKLVYLYTCILQYKTELFQPVYIIHSFVFTFLKFSWWSQKFSSHAYFFIIFIHSLNVYLKKSLWHVIYNILKRYSYDYFWCSIMTRVQKHEEKIYSMAEIFHMYKTAKKIDFFFLAKLLILYIYVSITNDLIELKCLL